MSRYLIASEENFAYLAHHGILGQKWGIRRFQNEDGSLTEAGKERYGKALYKSAKKAYKNGPYRSENGPKIMKNIPEEKLNDIRKINKELHKLEDELMSIADALYGTDEYYYLNNDKKYSGMMKKVEELETKRAQEAKKIVKDLVSEKYRGKTVKSKYNSETLDDYLSKMVKWYS